MDYYFVSLDSSHLVMPGLRSQASHYCMLVLQLSGLLPPPVVPGGVEVGVVVDGGVVVLPLAGLLVLCQVLSYPLYSHVAPPLLPSFESGYQLVVLLLLHQFQHLIHSLPFLSLLGCSPSLSHFSASLCITLLHPP